MDSERIPSSWLRGQHVTSSAELASELQQIDIFLARNPAKAGLHLGAGSFKNYFFFTPAFVVTLLPVI